MTKMTLIVACAYLALSASAKVYLHSTFDLEIAAKSETEKNYHDFMMPLMTGMINDRNLSSLRALHPLLNPGRDSRANGILFEFESLEKWSAFTSTWNLHFLSLSTWWKNWRSSLWTSKSFDGPLIAHESAEGKYYYIAQLDVSLKPNTESGYQSTLNNMLSRVTSVLKANGNLVSYGTAVESGHSYATHRLTFEFSDWAGINALYTNNDYTTFIAAGSSNTNGFFASWAREIIIAPAPVVLGTGADSAAKQ
jgi:uncharacterized protein (DUF1330 family)